MRDSVYLSVTNTYLVECVECGQLCDDDFCDDCYYELVAAETNGG